MNESNINLIAEKGRVESLKEAAVYHLGFTEEEIKKITVDNRNDDAGPCQQAFKLLEDIRDIILAMQRKPPG